MSDPLHVRLAGVAKRLKRFAGQSQYLDDTLRKVLQASEDGRFLSEHYRPISKLTKRFFGPDMVVYGSKTYEKGGHRRFDWYIADAPSKLDFTVRMLRDEDTQEYALQVVHGDRRTTIPKGSTLAWFEDPAYAFKRLDDYLKQYKRQASRRQYAADRRQYAADTKGIERAIKKALEWGGAEEFDDLFTYPGGQTVVGIAFIPADEVNTYSIERRAKKELRRYMDSIDEIFVETAPSHRSGYHDTSITVELK